VEHPTQNLTLAIDGEVLLEARKFALERRTTVNQLVREYLSGLVAQYQQRRTARARLKTVFQKGVVEVGRRRMPAFHFGTL